MATKRFTDKQQAFIDALFGEAHGDPKEAAIMAGYATTHISNIMTPEIKEEIIDRAKYYLALHSPKAVIELTKIPDKAFAPGSAVKLKAITEILDRVNITKTDKVEVSTPSGLFILPAKDEAKKED